MRVLILVNSWAIGYDFIDEKFADTVCQIIEIQSQCLIKFKQIQRFNGRAIRSIIHFIYSILTINLYNENFAP